MVANTIQLDGEGFILEEAIGNGAIPPGALLTKQSDGRVHTHLVEGGPGLVMVAVEDALQGKTYRDAYASGARVTYHIQRPGTRVQALLKLGEIVNVGDPLISDGTGRVINLTSASSTAADPLTIVGWAEENLDLSVSDAVETLVAMRAN